MRHRVRLDLVSRHISGDVVARRLTLQQEAGAFCLADAASRKRGDDGRTHQDLARIGDVFHADGTGPAGPRDDEFAMRPADMEEVVRPGVDADRHAELEVRAAGQLDPANIPKCTAHPHRRTACVGDVVTVLEQEQQRVAAELDQAAIVGVRDRQQIRETRLDRVGDLLGPLPADLRELLGELREPRDIDEDDGAVDRPPQVVRGRGEVTQKNPWDVRVKWRLPRLRRHRRDGIAGGGPRIHSGAAPDVGWRSLRRLALAEHPPVRCPPMLEDQDLTAALHAARQRRKTLHDTLVHLEEALSSPAAGRIPGWTATVLKELYEVRDAFEQHILVTEQTDGLYDEILDRAPRLAGNVRRLRDEHPEIREGIAANLEHLEHTEIGSDGWPLDEARDDLQRFIGSVIRHRQRGADLVWEAYNVDIGGLE